MERFKASSITKIENLHTGTSAQFIGINTITGKKGIYKENGCILGIDNDDIREKLSSDILHKLNIPCAKIDLVYDENTNSNTYFSNYIINDNEELISPDTNGCVGSSKDPINNLYEIYISGVKKLSTDKQVLTNAKNNFFKYAYMCCILDSYDIKADNLPLIHNTETNELYPAPWFDFGTAFCKEHKSAPLYETSTDEMMESLFKNHFKDIKDTVKKVNSTLTKDKLTELFNRDYIKDSLTQEEIEQIRSRIDSQIDKSKTFEINQRKDMPSTIKSFILSIKSKLNNAFGKSIPKSLPEETTPNITFIDNSNTIQSLTNLTNENIEYTSYTKNTQEHEKEL